MGDNRLPHRFPMSAVDAEVIAWKCQACGEWIREFGKYEPGECTVDWRNEPNP